MRSLSKVFSADVLAKLAQVRRPIPSRWDSGGRRVRDRHVILGTTGPEPAASNWAFCRAWNSYLSASQKCGLLDDQELLSRLRGEDDDGFRGAMAECLTAFYFRVRLRAEVTSKPEGTNTKNVDLLVVRGGLGVYAEVKAPYVPLLNSHGSGDDAKALLQAIEKAGTQMKKGRANLVVLVPSLRTSVRSHRGQLLKATIGEHAISFFVSLDGSPPPKPQPTFLQKGKLAKLWRTTGGAFQTDLSRISAVMTIEEIRPHEHRLGHSIVVVHNPFAKVPIPREFFGRVPQWLIREGKMGWSDRYRGP